MKKSLLIMLLLSLTAFAQTPAPSPKANDGEKATEEVVILRAQLETMKEYNDKLMNTVYWSLGTIVGISVLLIGFSWFTNYKIYERDKAALRQELIDASHHQVTQIKENLERHVGERVETLTASSADVVESAIASFQGRFDQLRKQLLRLEFAATESEARYWGIKGVERNEMDRYREMLEISLRTKETHLISKSLQGLTRLFKDGVFPWWGDVPSLTAALDLVPPAFSVEVETLRDLLKKAK